MPRPSQVAKKRKELLPVIARAFSELGYHRATTAELARRSGVRENILYRLWRDKKEMFIASIDHVFQVSVEVWTRIGRGRGKDFSPEAVLDYESKHLGEFGNYRLIFAGLTETDDPEIREAVARLYKNFHSFIAGRLADGSAKPPGAAASSPELAAWALIGLGTVFTIGRELKLMDSKLRRRLLADVGKGFLKS
jgi:AcrR family transcriptional regulator